MLDTGAPAKLTIERSKKSKKFFQSILLPDELPSETLTIGNIGIPEEKKTVEHPELPEPVQDEIEEMSRVRRRATGKKRRPEFAEPDFTGLALPDAPVVVFDPPEPRRRGRPKRAPTPAAPTAPPAPAGPHPEAKAKAKGKAKGRAPAMPAAPPAPAGPHPKAKAKRKARALRRNAPWPNGNGCSRCRYGFNGCSDCNPNHPDYDPEQGKRRRKRCRKR